LALLVSVLGGALVLFAGWGCGPKETREKVTEPPAKPVAVKPPPEQPVVKPVPKEPPVKPPGEEVAVRPPVKVPPVRRPRPRPKPVRLDKRDLKSLLTATKDADPRVRAAAANALGRLGDLQALWPLVQLAARDRDRKVREAAVLAITYLGPETDGEQIRHVRKELRAKLARTDLRRTPLQEALAYLGERSALGMTVHWNGLAFAGVSRDQRLTLRARDAGVGVVACRLLVACKPTKPVGFLWCDRWEFGTVEALARKKAAKLRRLARRRYSQAGKANQETWRKLCQPIPRLRGERVALATAISHIRRAAGVAIEVDWKALQKVGVEVDTRVSGYRDNSRAGWALETILLQAGLGEIDYLVHNGAVLVSSAQALDERMKAKEKGE
jgi:hypothetical protein